MPVSISSRLLIRWVCLSLFWFAFSGHTFSAALTYVVNNAAGSVTAFDLQTNSVVATIPVGSSPTEIYFAPSNRLGYVTNEASNTISVIDLAAQNVRATIPVGHSPMGVMAT